MAVMVDEIQAHPNARIACFRPGACHLTADTAEELHEFAERIGLRREWFQPQSHPHYDLTVRMRAKALRHGAVMVPAREQARRRIAVRRVPTEAR